MGWLGLGLGLVLRLGLGLALWLQLGIGIGFRHNHSWSSTFTPRRNHSLYLLSFKFYRKFHCMVYCSCDRSLREVPRHSVGLSVRLVWTCAQSDLC